MANTIVSLFEKANDAQSVVKELMNIGIGQSNVQMMDKSKGDLTTQLTGRGVTPDAARVYNDGVRRGNTLLAIDVEDSQIEPVMDVLSSRGAIDINERAEQYRSQGSDDLYLNNDRTQGEYALPVVEEQMQVGKRMVERGGVRVYNRVTERPVEETVTLREEHVNVERRPVNRAVTDADMNNFKEGVIEVSEKGEEAVVSKQARVVEEVVVNKQVGERTETVGDTVRRTDVDVEQVDADTTRTRGARGGTDR